MQSLHYIKSVIRAFLRLITFACVVWLGSGCGPDEDTGDASFTLAFTSGSNSFRFAGTIHLLDEGGNILASVEADENDPATRTVSLPPGMYTADVATGYSCLYSGPLEPFAGCTFQEATPAPFQITRGNTAGITLIFVLHSEQYSDAYLVFEPEGDQSSQ